MVRKRQVQVIINPVSGRAGGRAVLEGLCARMREAGHEVRRSTTARRGDAREAAAQACGGGVDVLVVYGGDGTVSEVVEGMAGEGVPILVVPGGTENILACYLGIRPRVPSLWRTFNDGHTARFDVPRRNGRRFLLVAGAGADGEITRLLGIRRRGHISYWSYARPIWRTLRSYREPAVSVEADGELIHEGPGWVVIGNVSRHALGLPILARAVPDDGLLDVCVLQGRGPFRQLWHVLKVLLRRHLPSASVVYAQARRVRVWSDERVPVQVDGDFDGWLPAAFDLAPYQVRLLVPADGSAAEPGRDQTRLKPAGKNGERVNHRLKSVAKADRLKPVR